MSFKVIIPEKFKDKGITKEMIKNINECLGIGFELKLCLLNCEFGTIQYYYDPEGYKSYLNDDENIIHAIIQYVNKINLEAEKRLLEWDKDYLVDKHFTKMLSVYPENPNYKAVNHHNRATLDTSNVFRLYEALLNYKIYMEDWNCYFDKPMKVDTLEILLIINIIKNSDYYRNGSIRELVGGFQRY
jgi:hypothetical protein